MTYAAAGALGVLVCARPSAAAEGPPLDPRRDTAEQPRRSTRRPTAPNRDPSPRGPHGPGTRRNAIILGTQAKIPHWGSSLSYQRALSRRVSVGVGIEYGYQPSGYGHLQGVGEYLSARFWLGRVFHGVFAEGSMVVAHQFLSRQPRLSVTALAPRAALGYRWTHRNGLSVGGSAGLRWGRIVRDSPLICTRPQHCTMVREGPRVQVTVEIGYVF